MNAAATNLVGRGSRLAHGGNGEIAPSITARFVRPLSPPSRSLSVASIKNPALHTPSHGSARFSAKNIPRSHTMHTLRTPAFIREPRPTNYDL
jgi:hypothetical protein